MSTSWNYSYFSESSIISDSGITFLLYFLFGINVSEQCALQMVNAVVEEGHEFF
jgi:hypothetical protein